MENIFSITEKYDPIDSLIISLIFQTITAKRPFIGEENGGFYYWQTLFFIIFLLELACETFVNTYFHIQ